MNSRRFFQVLLLLSFWPVTAAEGEKDRWGFGFQPILGYDDEAGWTAGGRSAFYFNPNPDDPSQELDEFDLTATATTNKWANLSAEATKNLRGNDRVVKAGFGCEKYGDVFYGTGGRSTEADRTAYTVIDAPFNLSYSFRVIEHLYVSAAYDFLYHDISLPDNAAPGNELLESDDTHCSGIGVGLEYRTTNPGLYKRRGYQVSLSSIWYSPVLLSSSAFERAGAGFRYYIPLFSRCVLGFQLRAETTRGDVPVQYLPAVGGNKLVRGFDNSRYVGRHCFAGQAEFRFPIWWRFGGTVFAGAGEAADRVGDFNGRPRAAGGVGFRVTVQKRQNINIRFDLAWSSDHELKKYIKLKEAF